MDFGKAQELLLAGKHVARSSWPSGTYIEFHSPEGGQYGPFHKIVNGQQVRWLGADSHTDAGATDWIQIGE